MDERSVQRIADVASVLAILIGADALLGLFLHSSPLQFLMPVLAGMRVNTAVLILIAGISLRLQVKPEPSEANARIARVCALLVIAIGAMTLAEYAFAVDLGIDQLLHRVTGGDVNAPFPGRMSPNTALCLTLLGVALALLDIKCRALHWTPQALTIVALSLAFVAFVGYLLNVTALYAIPGFAPMRFETSIGVALLCVGLLAARPRRGIAAILVQDNPAGGTARRALPLTILAVLAVGWVRLKGQQLGFYDGEVGLGLMVTVCTGILASLVIWNANVQGRTEKSRQEAIQLIDAVKDYAICMLDPSGNIVTWNAGAERLKGYKAAEIIGSPLARFYTAEDAARNKPAQDLETASRGEGIEVEGWRLRKDGSKFLANVVITALRNDNGQLIGFAKVTRDITERALAAEQLRLALEGRLQSVQQALNTIIDALPSMISYWDRNLINGLANRAHGRWFATEPAKMPGMHLRDFFGEELFERNRVRVAATLRGEACRFEERLRRPDGKGFNHVIGHYVPNVVDGEVTGFYALVHDVTEITESKNKLDELMRENENLLSTLHAHTLVSVTDRDGRITEVNDAFCAISGYTREELLGQDYRMVSSGKHPRSFWKDLWRDIGNAKPWRGQICNRAKDGSLYWVDSIIAPFVGEDGRIVKYISIRTDITAQKESQRRLAESEAFLDRVEMVSRVGGFKVDLITGIPRWTRQSCRLHDLEEGASPTREQVDSFQSAEVRALTQSALRTARESGAGFDIEIPMVTAKGRPIWIRAAGEVEREEGIPVRVVGALQDVTARRLMEQQLRDATDVAERANRAKSEFLANMSHEIRTPLNAVIGLGYLLEQTTLSADQRQLLTKIQFAGRALLGVINNVLDLTKVEAGEMLLEEEPFDLPELIRDLSQMLAPQATTKGIDLIVQPASTLPQMVSGDEGRLRQILTNLLANSIKFTETGHVELKVFCTEQSPARIRLRCEVIDTGIGIAPEAIERLFTPFTQADASTTRRFGGTGLGLSIVRRYLDLMGGEIGVTSVLGSGSTFWIEMPLQVAPNASSALRTAGASALRILIANSTSHSTEDLSAMTRALGWSPRVADSAEQLLGIVSGRQPGAWPDVLILQRHLLDDEGHRWISLLRKECHSGELPPVIVVTDAVQAYEHHEPLRRATDVLLVRPLASSALFNSVNSAISRRHAGRERLLESTRFDEQFAQWLPGVGVLVVDDSDINLEVAQRILEKQGAIVTTCSNGSAAVEHVLNHLQDLDVVLMDVQMPVLDGNEATRRIRKHADRQMLPIIALTAGALVGERQRALDAGMNDFLSKPFDPQILIRKVRRLVEQARGEPLRMVVLDPQPIACADGWPVIACVDAAIAQQMFDSDARLYKSALGRVLKEHAAFALPASDSLEDPTVRREIEARAHKLKGSASILGATDVARLAGATEAALESGRPEIIVEELLRHLSAAMTTLHEQAMPLLETKAEPAPEPRAESTPVPGISGVDFDELCSLLESQNLAALDKLSSLSPSLSERLGRARFDRIREAVDALDFQLGASLLRGAPAN